ncbi:3-Oxoacyl-(acyl-carrier-protein (ACP)) synthase III domain protein [Chthoniobacter flavus Ellin428]|uniref:3-Oxoacyl-(Acyl-carrier-protein (ACP)) synthase III domain protein n=1 Tax=Chthoniobacter flavus Ellin428 TaxID=497964 RepID=B4CXM9_9BACT|nr:3-oxoacyl-[acyl-carrier-protein] synthase III C-terminal domain-containing protein [Chthoniobacter flavus]EDY21027.1 3-Oxoacyl-(acyl-carrier-protein (ACP)) synthase III domain protein [Chthoniobacter flavus Ellin428]TCO88752.1 3-oxoacyl-[acyl-carrier-protein] synthase-3 [Chthoniobacter flavus]
MQIIAITYALGSEQIPVEKLGLQAALPPAAIAQMLDNGLQTVPVWPGEKRPLALQSFIASFGREQCEALHSLKAVIVAKTHLGAHTLRAEDARDWFSSREGHPALAMEVTGQPCAILHSGVELARRLLARSNGEEPSCVLLVGCDVAENAAERCYFGSAMGDACVAMLLSMRAGGPAILGSHVETNIVAPLGEQSDPNEIARFRQHNVFWIREAIFRGLAKADRSLDTHCIILPHTPNRHIVEAIRQSLALPHDRIISEFMATTGHCCSNDSFITFARLVAQGRLQKYSTAVLVNGGFGGTRGVTVIEPSS